jgi:Ni/Fe-hydrogenase subunit HybB-like protein
MNPERRLPRAPVAGAFWRAVFLVVAAGFALATVLRFAFGLGAVTNLSDRFPWGLWIGFDVLCGVGLAAGAFTLTAVVHLLNLRRFEPILRSTVLTALLGYWLVIVALLFDLGQPWRIWHPIVFRNPRSVMFEVAWCVMLYTTVLLLEFVPVLLERWSLPKARRFLHGVTTPLVIAGVILSTLHQSSLGSLYLIVPEKLHPLWYSPLLPVLFFLSAVGSGLGMVVLESWLSGRAFGRELEMELLEPLGRAMAVVLGIYGLLRLIVLRRQGALGILLDAGYEQAMFWMEFALGVVVPVGLLAIERVRRSPSGLVVAAFFSVLGLVANRLNVSVTGMERAAGVRYVPSVMEVLVSVGLVAVGFALFAFLARWLPLFPERPPKLAPKPPEPARTLPAAVEV